MSGSRQQRILEGLEKILLTYCNKKVFSASAVAFFHDDTETAHQGDIYCGTIDTFSGKKTDKNALFDLASLTKPLVTLLSVLTLIERKELSWSDTAGSFFLTYRAEPLMDVDIHSLLCHASGLPAHKNYWMILEKMDFNKRRRWLLDKISTEKRVCKNGEKHIYSDLGYLLLGFIVEEKTGKNLADFWKETIAEPLGIEKKLFFPPRFSPEGSLFVATDGNNKKNIPGVVHDKNCRAMGGVCGHAGLFGTASGVILLCRELLCSLEGKKHNLPFSSRILQRACSRVGNSEWTAGFNLPSRQGSSSGSFFSEKSIGHLGFTGTSFWIDPLKNLVVVLLTNRVIEGENKEGIKEFRPRIHNYIAEQLGLK